MKIAIFRTSLLFVFFACELLPVVSAQEFEYWRGTVEVDETEVKIEVKLTRSFSTISGSLKMPDLTPIALPLTNIDIEGRKVYFELEMGPNLAIYDGSRTSTKTAKGKWTQKAPTVQGNTKGVFSLDLKEITKDLSNSIEESVELDTKTGTIYGTLLTPDIPKPPLALLISGSGSSDRDGNVITGTRMPVLELNVLKLLAIGLSNEGIATVRFDKRGVGESIYEGFDESDLRIETHLRDVLGWLRKVKADDRFSKLLIIGFQEGALLAKLAAIEFQVSGVVSLAGAGVPVDQIFLEQIENHPAMFPELVQVKDELETTLKALKNGEELPELPPSLQTSFRESIRNYLRSWFKYDPAQIAAKLEVPLLVVQGTTDLQVARSNGQKLARANPNARLVEIDQMNQALKTAGEDIAQQLMVLTDKDAPLHTKLVPVVAEFVHKLEN